MENAAAKRISNLEKSVSLYASFFFSLYRDGEKCSNHPTTRPNPNKPGRVGWGKTEGLYLLHKLEKHTEKNHKHTTSQNTRRSLVPVSSEFIANIGLSGFRIQILQRSSGFTIHCINLSPPLPLEFIFMVFENHISNYAIC